MFSISHTWGKSQGCRSQKSIKLKHFFGRYIALVSATNIFHHSFIVWAICHRHLKYSSPVIIMMIFFQFKQLYVTSLKLHLYKFHVFSFPITSTGQNCDHYQRHRYVKRLWVHLWATSTVSACLHPGPREKQTNFPTMEGTEGGQLNIWWNLCCCSNLELQSHIGINLSCRGHVPQMTLHRCFIHNLVRQSKWLFSGGTGIISGNLSFCDSSDRLKDNALH